MQDTNDLKREKTYCILHTSYKNLKNKVLKIAFAIMSQYT